MWSCGEDGSGVSIFVGNFFDFFYSIRVCFGIYNGIGIEFFNGFEDFVVDVDVNDFVVYGFGILCCVLVEIIVVDDGELFVCFEFIIIDSVESWYINISIFVVKWLVLWL